MSQAAASHSLRPFKALRFGRYTLLMPISSGGMGEVFLALGEGSSRLCVLKKLHPHLADHPDFVERFVDGLGRLKLSHPNIARTLERGIHEGQPYAALEFVDGKDLRRVLARMRERRLPLPLSFVLLVMAQVLDGLAYAHRKQDDSGAGSPLMHGDLSPQHLLIGYQGEVKIIDLGLAGTALAKASPGVVPGKLMYLAPELVHQQARDTRADIYAVGLCLWELVTGKSPFSAVSPGELQAAVGRPRIAPLSTLEPLCSPMLSEVVAKALEVDPAQRFQSADEFAGRLRFILRSMDPLADAQSVSRFMRDVFATEYQAERSMLVSVAEQAKALTATSPEEPVEEWVENPLSLFGVEPTVSNQPLAFQPTRKNLISARHLQKVEEHDRETMPAIRLKVDSAPTVPEQQLPWLLDQDATHPEASVVPSQALPSIVVEGIESWQLGAGLDAPEPPQPQSRPGREKTGVRPPPSRRERSGRKEESASKPGRKKKRAWAWFILPALALALLGSLVAHRILKAEPQEVGEERDAEAQKGQ